MQPWDLWRDSVEHLNHGVPLRSTTAVKRLCGRSVETIGSLRPRVSLCGRSVETIGLGFGMIGFRTIEFEVNEEESYEAKRNRMKSKSYEERIV